MQNLVICRVKKSFLGYNQGAVIQLESSEFKELFKKGLVEEIKNKKAKNFSSKLKKAFLVFIAGAGFSA